MKRQIVVIGLGRLGSSLAVTLAGVGHEVLALDSDEKNVLSIASEVTHAVQVDVTSEQALRQLGITNFDIAIITMPEIETSVLATILVKKLGIRYIIGRAVNELHGSILEKIGADKVVYPERDMGIGMAYVLTLGDVIDYIPVTPNYGVVRISVPTYFVGSTLADLGFGRTGKWEVIVLLLQRRQDVIVSPNVMEVVKPSDVLVVSGSFDKLEQLFAQIQKHKTV
jgi:trk system potassium uptake protein